MMLTEEASNVPGGTLRTIYVDDDVQVVHRQGSSFFSLVTFGAFGHRPSNTRLWGERMIEKLDLDAVGFIARNPDWYPAAAIVRSLPAVQAVLRPTTVGYGFSMGGYAALKHGRVLGMTHCLSISPQLTIDPGEVPDDQRFHRFHKPEVHGGMRVTSADLARFPVLMADPYDPEDRLHWMAAPAAIHRIPLPFMGHGAVWMLASSRLMAKALDRLLANDAAGLHRVLRSERSTSPDWHRWVSYTALARGKEQLADQILRRGIDLSFLRPVDAQAIRGHGLEGRLRRVLRHNPAAGEIGTVAERAKVAYGRNTAGLMRVANLLFSHNRFEESERIFAAVIAVNIHVADAHFRRVQSLRRLNRLPDALEGARQGAACVPNDARLMTILGHLMLEQQDGHGAEAAYRAAVATDPTHGPAWLALSRRMEADGRLAEAKDAAERALTYLPAGSGRLAQEIVHRLGKKSTKISVVVRPWWRRWWTKQRRG